MESSSGSLAKASPSASSKRSCTFPEDDEKVARRFKVEPGTYIPQVETEEFAPIGTLGPTAACPPIKAKVTQASQWITANTRVQYMFFILRDASGTISGTVFGPMNSYFDNHFKLGARVIVRGAKVHPEKPEYVATKGKYHLKINQYSVVQFENDFPSDSDFDRLTIKAVHDTSRDNEVVDVFGILTIDGEGGSNSRHEIELIDESEANIMVTLSDQAVRNLNADPGTVIVACKAVVRISNGTKTLITRNLTLILVDPPDHDTSRLKKWWSDRTRLPEIKKENAPQVSQTPVSELKVPSIGLRCKKLSELIDSPSRKSDVPREIVFTSIREVKSNGLLGTKYNIHAVVVVRDPVKYITTKAGSSSPSRNIVVSDEQDSEIEMTVWGGQVDSQDIPLHSIIIGTNVTVRMDWEQKKLNCLWAQLKINPNVPRPTEFEKVISSCDTGRNESSDVVASIDYSSRKVDVPRPTVFTSIGEVKSNGIVGTKYNIIGVVIDRELPKNTTTKAGKVVVLRNIVVSDGQESQIGMTIWGGDIDTQDIPLHSVIKATNVDVRMYDNQRSLNSLWKFVQLNPDEPLAHELKKLATTGKIIPHKIVVANNFSTVDEIIERQGTDSKYNLIGIVIKINPAVKRGPDSDQRPWMTPIEVEDKNGSTIRIDVWSNEPIQSEIPLDTVIAVRGATTTEFNEYTTLRVSRECLTIDPDLPAARCLKKSEPTKIDVSKRLSHVDNEFGDYTPIDLIIRRNEPTDNINTIGLVVEVDAQRESIRESHATYETKCILRSKNGYQIELNITADNTFDIPMHNVIIARKATVWRSKDKKELSLYCLSMNIDFDINIPEADGFKDAAMHAIPQTGDPVAPDPNRFTELKSIKTEMPLGCPQNVIGLVVDVFIKAKTCRRTLSNDDDEANLRSKYVYTTRVVLRGMDRELIVLNVRRCTYHENSIRVNTIIAARDALFRMCEDEMTLWCLRSNVEINPKLPQSKQLAGLVGIPFARGYMPFKTIAREQSLIGCKMNIIGQVTEVIPVDAGDDRKPEDRGQTFILRNGTEIRLHVFGINEPGGSSGQHNAIETNSIIAVRNAMLRGSPERLSFQAFWTHVEVNPKIPERDEASRPLRVTKIAKILEKARDGDSVGVLAVVETPPRKIIPGTDFAIGDPELSYVKLIDESGQKINLIVSTTIANTLTNNNDEIVIVRSINLLVREKENQLELWCTNSLIDINPKTDDAKALLAWYEEFTESKPNAVLKCAPIIPISRVHEELANNATASVMGIVIGTKMQRVEKDGMRFEVRKIEIIDESRKTIQVLLWNWAARDCNVSLHSVVRIRNFRYRTKGGIKYGDFVQETDITENPSDRNDLRKTERLKIWSNENREELLNFEKNSVPGVTVKKEKGLSSYEEICFDNDDDSDCCIIIDSDNADDNDADSDCCVIIDDDNDENNGEDSDCCVIIDDVDNHNESMGVDPDSPDIFSDW